MIFVHVKHFIQTVQEIRNDSNNKLMESTILSSRIRWSDKDAPSLKDGTSETWIWKNNTLFLKEKQKQVSHNR